MSTNKKQKFQYPEDKKFFYQLLKQNGVVPSGKRFYNYFDFRDPKIKREEFNRIRNTVFQKLVWRYRKKCQLKIHPDCSKIHKFNIDHLIPLSTNELNKGLRGMQRIGRQKVPAQSFGSNNLINLYLACERCNSFKKHRFLFPAVRIKRTKL